MTAIEKNKFEQWARLDIKKYNINTTEYLQNKRKLKAIKKYKLKKCNLKQCQQMASNIIATIMESDTVYSINIERSGYGTIYLTIGENTIRISDHEIDTINYDYQLIINELKKDSLTEEQLEDIIYQ